MRVIWWRVLTYTPPDSVIVDRIQRAFPSDELRERARATDLVQRERKFDFVSLFYMLSFGFAAGSDRSIQVLLECFVEMVDCDELAYISFTNRFSPTLVATLRAIFDDEPSIPPIGISLCTSKARDFNWPFEMNSSGSVRIRLSLGSFITQKSGQRLNQSPDSVTSF